MEFYYACIEMNVEYRSVVSHKFLVTGKMVLKY